MVRATKFDQLHLLHNNIGSMVLYYFISGSAAACPAHAQCVQSVTSARCVCNAGHTPMQSVTGLQCPCKHNNASTIRTHLCVFRSIVKYLIKVSICTYI